MKLLKTYKHKGYERLKIEHPYNTCKGLFYWFGAEPFIYQKDFNVPYKLTRIHKEDYETTQVHLL